MGFRADLLRMLVVFLHATIEDLVRSHLRRPNKQFTFSSVTDIEKALKQLNIKVSLFADLLPALTQMAKRRNRIVHRADLEEHATTAKPWALPDDWELIHWHLGVSTFHYRLRKATGHMDLVEQAPIRILRALWSRISNLQDHSFMSPGYRKKSARRLYRTYRHR